MSTYCRGLYGYRNCNDGLSYGARIGIGKCFPRRGDFSLRQNEKLVLTFCSIHFSGIAIAVVVIGLVVAAGLLARRQRQRRFAAHQASINQAQMQYGGQGPGTYGGYAQDYNAGYQPSGGYTQASPYGQTPAGGNYAPPSGPPPTDADGNRAETGQAGFFAPPPGPPPPAYQPATENKANNN